MLSALALSLLLVAAPADGPSPSPAVRGPAGRYTIDVPSAAVVTYGPTWVTIRWDEGPGPNPGPTPDPAPPPPVPTPNPPLTGTLYAVLVLPATPTPAQAALKTDAALRTAVRAADARLFVYLGGEEDVRALKLDATIKDTPLPAVVVYSNRPGEPSRAFPVAKGADVADAIAKARAGK